ncbi:MAG: hypothetical protein QM811_01655 [Pirellulales bacterium]
MRTLNRLRGKSAGAAGTDFALPPRPLNALLTNCFAGEGELLARALRAGRRGFAYGASQVALLERLPGKIQARTKPRDVTRDAHDPELVCAR